MDAPRTQPARGSGSGFLNGALVCRWLAGSAIVILGFVVARRLAGAMQIPAAIGTSLLAGVALAVFLGWLRKNLVPLVGGWPAFGMASSIALIAAAALTLAGTPAVGLLAIWLPIVGVAAWAFGQEWAGESASTALLEHDPPDEAAIIVLNSAPEAVALADPTIVQHLVRRQEAAGAESIRGILRADFAPAERTRNLHVPFCPPLATIPACEAEAVDGPPARVKITQVLAQGARLEVRLEQPAMSPQQVTIEFTTI